MAAVFDRIKQVLHEDNISFALGSAITDAFRAGQQAQAEDDESALSTVEDMRSNLTLFFSEGGGEQSEPEPEPEPTVRRRRKRKTKAAEKPAPAMKRGRRVCAVCDKPKNASSFEAPNHKVCAKCINDGHDQQEDEEEAAE